MGYRPNLTARGLRTNKHYTIGLLFFNPSELLYGELLTELHVRLTRRRYAGVSAFWNTDEEAVAAFQSVISRGIDGIITCHHDLSLVPDGIPVVTFESRNQERDCIYRDGQGAVRKALLHLLDLGHRRFGMVNMNRAEQEVNVMGVLGSFQLAAAPVWVSDDSDVKRGYLAETRRGIEKLLSQPPKQRPTALVCRNDTVAIQAMSTAGQLGLRVPNDLSVIGFDGIALGAISNPPLTTLGTPTSEIAQQLADLMWRRIKQPDAPAKHIELEKSLIARESCAQPPVPKSAA